MDKILYFILFMFLLILVSSIIGRRMEERQYPKKIARSGIKDIDKMDGFQFERYLNVLFYRLGYKTSVTKKSGDFGADLILQGTNRIVVQAKRYGHKNKVGIAAVQEVFAARAYYKANEAWVVTNSVFTEPAKKLALACRVKLIDREGLMDLIIEVNPDTTAKEIYETVEPKKRICPMCKKQLVVRTSKESGERFFGCVSFPVCRHTEKINK